MPETDRPEVPQPVYDIFPISRHVSDALARNFLVKLKDKTSAGQLAILYLQDLQRGNPLQLLTRSEAVDVNPIPASEALSAYERIQRNQQDSAQAAAYIVGSVIYLEAAKREAEAKGGTLSKVTEDGKRAGIVRLLDPEDNPHVAQAFMDLQERFNQMIADGNVNDALALLGDPSVEPLLIAKEGIIRQSIQRAIKSLPKDEPHLYKTLKNENLIPQPRRYGQISGPRIRNQFFRGLVETKNLFEGQKSVHDLRRLLT